jgi:hypothetical protein
MTFWNSAVCNESANYTLKLTDEHTVESNVLSEDSRLGLVLFVDGNLDKVALDHPSVPLHQTLQLVVRNIEPRLHYLPLGLTCNHRRLNRDRIAHDILETNAVGDKVGVQIIRLKSCPKLTIRAGLDKLVEGCEFTNSVGEIISSKSGIEDIGREEMDAKREVGRGEDCERFDKDVGDGFVLGEVGIELVSEVHRGIKDQQAIARRLCSNHAKQRGEIVFRLDIKLH